MAIPLIFSFSLVDWFYVPEHLYSFFILRVIVVLATFSVLQLYRSLRIQIHHHQLPAVLIAVFLGIYHGIMVYYSGGAESAYYVGITIAAVGYTIFLPWRLESLFAALVFHYVPYFVAVAMHPGAIAWEVFVPHVAFLFSMQGVGFFALYYNRSLRKKEFGSRLDLEKDNLQKEKIIEEKTRERTQLEKLMGQFSPQVIQAIQSGELDVERKSRRMTTVIFLDIENSTGRSVKIDYLKYSAMISEFFTGCVEIFLEHDVTVGSYLGDGIMAFTNAPQDQFDHAARAFIACRKILQMHQQKKRYFLENWRADFNLRIGVEAGWTLCGFYPSQQRGTYTAIGDCANLAARLCSIAPRNNICVTKEYLRTVHDRVEDFQIRPLRDNREIKGFEGEYFDLYALQPIFEESEVTIEDGETCPLCQGVMRVESEHIDSSFIKCMSCGYIDLVHNESDAA